MKNYNHLALLEVERHGVVEYELKDNLLIWYVNYKEYHPETRHKRDYKGETYKVIVNLDTGKETRQLLKNYYTKGNVNKYS